MDTANIDTQETEQVRNVDWRKQFATMKEIGFLNHIAYAFAMSYFRQELSYEDALVGCVKKLSEKIAELQAALIDKEIHREQRP